MAILAFLGNFWIPVFGDETFSNLCNTKDSGRGVCRRRFWFPMPTPFDRFFQPLPYESDIQAVKRIKVPSIFDIDLILLMGTQKLDRHSPYHENIDPRE